MRTPVKAFILGPIGKGPAQNGAGGPEGEALGVTRSWGDKAFVAFLLLVLGTASVQAEPERWIHIDTEAATLSLMEENRPIRRFSNIAIGRGGTASRPRSGDNRTPVGEFRIGWINQDSRYHLFLGLAFPNLSQAARAWQNGVIDGDAYERIVRALRNHGVPPQDTPLGGYLGIHGLGQINPDLHRRLNWTEGCIAVTNRQIEALHRWANVGTKVVID